MLKKVKLKWALGIVGVHLTGQTEALRGRFTVEMRGRFIQILTVLITIAFVGLILIQIYWINNSIILRAAEFNYNVSRAMDKVVSQLEEVSVWNTNLPLTGSGSGMVVPDIDSPLILTDCTQQEQERQQLIDSIVLNGDTSLQDVLKGMSPSQQEILKQSGLLEDVKDGLLSIDILSGLSEEVNPEFIDSLLSAELNHKGITAKYAVGIFTWHDHPEVLTEKNEAWLDDLVENGFKTPIQTGVNPDDIYYLKVFFPHQKRYLLQTMWVMLSISALLMLSIMFAFLYTITTIFKQKKISEIKNDFINNMTHELKTPISTIGLACEALNDPVMRSSEQQLKNFVGMINEENKRLGVLVENVLRSAILDRADIQLRYESLNMHEVIQAVIRNIAIQVKKKGGTIKTNFMAFNPVIQGDRIHLTNLVYNLIDNAIKYSMDQPFVLIETQDTDRGIRLRFIDHGIGISKENQKKIFDKLYRVPTGDIHDVKGFGLGLSYVQAIVEKHHGTINVESELQKGSTFTIELPFDHEDEH